MSFRVFIFEQSTQIICFCHTPKIYSTRSRLKSIRDKLPYALILITNTVSNYLFTVLYCS